MAAAADEVAPPTASGYLDPSYWDERFGKEEHYEWFKDFSHFRHLLAPLLSPSLSVLEVGCGNSRLGEELLREGVDGGITCVDLSPVAVQRMRDRLAVQGTKGVDVVVADMLDLPFEQESFDLVIEKGTMDVLFVDSGDPWNPNPSTVNNVMKMLEEIHRVLKPEGIFVSITFGQGKRSLESNSYQNSLPAVPRINMVHEELESEDFIFRTNVDEL
ncbi:unnamed protein product [Urochloa decumbens]|uniref:Methyltransferase domain-containing protein n=1 Tax=Urochloa decumbens TaxID=240449 RepID=A0ABC9AVI3_9POAL